MNAPQYTGSEVCGMCGMITGTGQGSGRDPITGNFKIIVGDLCPECASGSLDLEGGKDGRWQIKWIATECGITSKVQYVFQGSNPYYIKLQVKNHNIPVKVVRLLNENVLKPLQRTSDNFFTSSGNIKFPMVFPIRIQVEAIDGQVFNDTISALTNDVDIGGTQQFGKLGGPPGNSAISTQITWIALLSSILLVFIV
jgi:expansin (peptidoglycan-binding protein)